MIGIGLKLVKALVGKKVEQQIADGVMDKLHVPDPIKSVVDVAITGDVGSILSGLGEKKK